MAHKGRGLVCFVHWGITAAYNIGWHLGGPSGVLAERITEWQSSGAGEVEEQEVPELAGLN